MRDAAWYVVQVQTGKEQAVCDAILRVAERTAELLQDQRVADQPSDAEHIAARTSYTRASDAPLVEECFSPRYAAQVKLHGEWVNEERPLIPGYVIVVTHDPWSLARLLREVPALTRLLKMGQTYAPLSKDDRSWIERWTSADNRVIPMSFARKVGDKIKVFEGPLAGSEATIVRIRRRKALADLEIRAGASGQITIHATVGLAVLPG